MNPASAQHAALRILLDDVDPLMQRAEEAAQTLMKVREELGTDLVTLGDLVQRSMDIQPALLEAGRKLNGSAARIEAALQLAAPGGSSGVCQVPRRSTLWVACAGSALLSGALVGGVCWAAAGPFLEQARVGRALQMAWPSLDATARMKVQTAGQSEARP